MSAMQQALARLPLFAGMSPGELKTLESILVRRPLSTGEVLFNEGDRPRGCFVLLTGEINVLKRMPGGRNEHLATLRPGALVGHVALIDRRPRSATCVASSRSLALELANDDFDRLFSANSPFAFKVLDRVALDLVDRLRTATERLTEAATATTPQRKRISVREAAEALLSGRASEFEGVDLDNITFSVPEFSKKHDRRRP